MIGMEEVLEFLEQVTLINCNEPQQLLNGIRKLVNFIEHNFKYNVKEQNCVYCYFCYPNFITFLSLLCLNQIK